MNNRELTHYGILGMKWGKRRYQNKDGSLTPAGRSRYDDAADNVRNTARKSAAVATKVGKDAASTAMKTGKSASSSIKNKVNGLSDKQKKLLKVGATAAAVVAIGPGKVIIGAVAATAIKSFIKKNPEKIANGKKKVDQMKNKTVSKLTEYSDVYKQS